MHKFAKYRFTCFCKLLRFHFFVSSFLSPPGCGRTNPLILERVHFFDRFRIRPSGSSHRSVHQPPPPPPPSPLSSNFIVNHRFNQIETHCCDNYGDSFNSEPIKVQIRIASWELIVGTRILLDAMAQQQQRTSAAVFVRMANPLSGGRIFLMPFHNETYLRTMQKPFRCQLALSGKGAVFQREIFI